MGHIHIHTMEYNSAIKRDEIMAFAATWIDLQIVILSEESQRQISHVMIYMWNLKNWHNWTYSQNRSRFTAIGKKIYGYQGGESGEEG